MFSFFSIGVRKIWHVVPDYLVAVIAAKTNILQVYIYVYLLELQAT